MSAEPFEPVLKIAVPVPLPTAFDYLPPQGSGAPGRGVRVLVRFGRRKLVGIVVAHARSSRVAPDRLNRIERILDDGRAVLDEELLELLQWCWNYYKHAPGEVVFNALPPALRRSTGAVPPAPVRYLLTAAGRDRLDAGPGRATAQWGLLREVAAGAVTGGQLRSWRADWHSLARKVRAAGWLAETPAAAPTLEPSEGPRLNAEQDAAVQAVRADFGRYRCHLLHGVTGSGKTEVYLRLAEEVIASGGQVLVLVPEIGLTTQLVQRMTRRLGLKPVVSHSRLAEGQRLEAWAEAASGRAPLLLGTRSALFLPLPRAGLIIMDESHDASFKQQEGFRFAGRDVAVKRASALGVPIVLGTATPSLETLHNAMSGRFMWHRLRERATGALQPQWQVLDLRQQKTRNGLSRTALASLEETLARGEQALVFLNRRGYAPVLLCHECGWHAVCRDCDANMTWHRRERALVCHHCGGRGRVPRLCPECAADALQGAGAGTEKLEEFLSERFSAHPLYRFDRDQTRRKGVFDQMVEQVREQSSAILLGTQMLAKGHHFPLVTLVLIVNVDQALYSADFRSLERMGQLLLQVAGRAGRAEHPGRVILQTHHPDHPLLEQLFRSGYEAFAMDLLEERRLAGLPPFSAQATLRAEAANRAVLTAFLEQAKASFKSRGSMIAGPFPALMERRGGRLRWYLLVQDRSRRDLQSSLDGWVAAIRVLPEAKKVRWAIDVDPQEF